MVLLTTVFAFTLLCAIVPCDISLDPPEVSIRSEYFTTGTRGSRHLKNEYPVVFTYSGGIRGYSMATILGNRIHAFEGIRYGTPPIGNLRFRAPLPAESWQGIRTAFKPGPRCIQFHPAYAFQVIGREDCLFLNVYSPNIQDPAVDLSSATKTQTIPVPVVVWFHGGSFIFGAGHEYGPAYITDQNLILVTVNYRLGVYGFMSTGDEASPGNYGLKDQVLAIKWIYENIGSFGGDPNKMTLMGQSAGGASAHLHMLSNTSRQYFRSAISMSSSAFSQWAVQDACQAKYWTNRLADLTKCPRTTNSSYALVECFRNMNPAFLVARTVHLFKWFVLPPVLFAPVVEIDHPGAFLTDTVANHYKTGNVARKPWLNGMTSQEGFIILYFLTFFRKLRYFRRHFTEVQPIVYDYDHVLNATSIGRVNKKIQDFYFGTESPETVSASTIAEITTDRFFFNAIITGIKAHSQIAPTYPYLFDFNGRTNMGKTLGLIKSEWGVAHTEDVFYYLNSSIYYDGMIKNTPDFELSQKMLNFLGNFVRKSIPYFTQPNATDTTDWKAQNPSKEVQFLYFGHTVKMVKNPFTERIEFWKTLGILDVTPFEDNGSAKSCN